MNLGSVLEFACLAIIVTATLLAFAGGFFEVGGPMVAMLAFYLYAR